MASIHDKATNVLRSADALELGEQVIVATKAMPLGGAKAIGRRAAPFAVAGVVGGLIGAAAAQAVLRHNPETIAAAFQNGVTIVLTDRRLLLMSQTAAGANPKEVVVAMPISSVHAVRMGTTRVSLVKLLTVSVDAAGYEHFDFEVPKPSTRDAEEVVALLQARLRRCA
jgi:hypothetical protein